MKKIETVSIVGLGALGVMYADRMVSRLGKNAVRVIVNEERKKRYESEGITCNGRPCSFHYVTEDEKTTPADLVIFAVKYPALKSAIASAQGQVGEDTVILSVMNGISSEEEIGAAFGPEKMLYCMVNGMDSGKSGSHASYKNMGTVVFGEKNNARTERVLAVADLLTRAEIAWEIPEDIMEKLWSKLMLNDGVNQSAAVFETGYGGLRKEGEARDTMLGAMREVSKIAEQEGIHLGEDAIAGWMTVLDRLNPEGAPSLRQDTLAHRKTEVELFGGTIRRLGKKYGIPTPYNDFLYSRILEIENSWNA